MRIGKLLNATKEELETKSFNIFYGLSLGNKYFTPEHIKQYLSWGIENTKDKIAVLIPDKIQAVNYEVKNGYLPKRALSVALRKGLELEEVVKKIIDELEIPPHKIDLVHWHDIEDEVYRKNLAIITNAFEMDQKFKDTVIQMVKEVPHLNGLNFNEVQYEKLAQYILNELPVLVRGLDIGGTHYGLFPYPGFVTLDYLALDLQEGKTFPELTAKLDIEEKLRLIELYAN